MGAQASCLGENKHTKPPVVDDNTVLLHHTLHVHQRVRSHLVAQAATARVDHDQHLAATIDAHLLRTRRVENLVHHLDLRVVVPCTQCSHLRQSALLCARGDFGGVGIQHATVLLTMLLVFAPGVTFAETPVHSKRLGSMWGDEPYHRIHQIRVVDGNDALGTHAHRDVVVECLRQLLLHRIHVLLVQIRADQAHAAVDVVAHAT